MKKSFPLPPSVSPSDKEVFYIDDLGILEDDSIELSPDDNYEFQTDSGITIYKVKFSEMSRYGFLNIVKKSNGMVMCQMIQRCNGQKLEKILSPQNIIKK
jgi:hypothetical protein